MSTMSPFRMAIVGAAVCVLIAIAAFANHFIAGNHPAFGAKAGIVFLLVAVCFGIYANYNRPSQTV